MKEKVLIGSGGFAQEVKAHMNNFKMKCFVDDKYFSPNQDNTYLIKDFNPLKMQALIVVGDPSDRKKIFDSMPLNTEYFTFIHPTVQIMDDNIEVGEGSFIGANSILTTNIKLGKHALLNRGNHIGHDCLIQDYFSAMPGAIISGNVTIGDCVYMGTNSSIKEKINVCDKVIIGSNATVVKNITESGTYVGVPAKKIF